MVAAELKKTLGLPIKPASEGSIDEKFQETLNNILEDIFGETSANMILQTIEKRHSLKWTEILDQAEVFTDALHEILGEGAVIIKRLILETFYAKLNLEFEWKKGYQFSDYINEIRNVTKKKVELKKWTEIEE